MIEIVHCEACGSPLAHEGLLGSSCPRCLLALASEVEDQDDQAGVEMLNTDTAQFRIPITIGRYHVVRLLGEGGMGAVLEAQQEHPRRTVAIKLIKPGLMSLEMLRRFEQESQALGRLQHAGIAQIYEAGTADTGYGSQPFFAMEFIHGETLLRYADTHRLSTHERLEIFARVCDAVHHAHQRGLIHRDLKPANILVDESGQPKVLDFGVARFTARSAGTTLHTGLGQLVGTLAYMSPEQALADPLDLDIRSDVYALGVILYELLSARLPYPIGKTVPDAVQAIRQIEPARLSSIDKAYRGDIETIVAKALEKEKSRRYSSAAELAADIQRHLRDEPISARPPSASYQLQKFTRRHRALVGGFAAVFVALAAGTVVSTWMALRASNAQAFALRGWNQAAKAEAAASEARDHAREAESATARERDAALRAQEDATRERNQAAAERDRITWQALARESVRLSATRGDDELAALLARQALLIHARSPDQPRYLVEEAIQQAARLSPWSRKFVGHEGAVGSIAFSADRGRIVSASADRTVRIWNINAASTSSVVLEEAETGATAVALSPDGTRLAAGFLDGMVKLWDLQDPEARPLSPARSQARNVVSIAFSPDGTRVAFADYFGAWIWEWGNPGSAPVKLQGPRLAPNTTLPFTSVAFSPDGIRVAGGDLFGGVRVWDVRNLSRQPVLFQGPRTRVNSVAFAPDSRHLASVADAIEDANGIQPLLVSATADWRIRIWDVENPVAPPMLLSGQQSKAYSVAYSTDGKLATAGHDGVVRVWDSVQAGSQPALLRSHEGAARSVVFSADGKQLVSSGNDYSIRIWNLGGSDIPFRPFKAHDAGVESLAFSPDSDYLVTGSMDRTARVWNLRDRAIPPVELEHEAPVQHLTFSHDGLRLASGTMGIVRIWNMHSFDAPAVVIPDRHGFQSVRFSRKGADLVTSTLSNPIMLGDFNSKGATPALVLSVPALKRWNLRNATSEIVLEDKRIAGNLTALSDDESLFASGPGDGEVWVWNLRRPTVAPLRLPGQMSFLSAVAFEAGGRRLASAGADLSVRIWDLDNPGTPRVALRTPRPGFFVKFLSGNTRLLVGGLGSEETRIWDLRAPYAPPVAFKGGNTTIRSIAVSPDESRIAVGYADGNVWVWNLWSVTADELCNRVSRNLSVDEWRFYIGDSTPYTRTCPALPDGKDSTAKSSNKQTSARP